LSPEPLFWLKYASNRSATGDLPQTLLRELLAQLTGLPQIPYLVKGRRKEGKRRGREGRRRGREGKGGEVASS